MTGDALKFFESKVRLILVENCQKCHSGAQPKGGLRLDSRAGLVTGGDRGPVVVPGKPAESLLVRAIGYEDPELKMPPSGRLTREQREALTRWVETGAAWGSDSSDAGPTVAVPGGRRRGEFHITDEDRSHWAFRPVKRPPVPSTVTQSWVTNPIDAFILARLEEAGLAPNPQASPRELIRRLSYDLIGLPPTPSEVDEFVALWAQQLVAKNQSENAPPPAYLALVDRLLASPRYGEKWGRHWLDLVRFAETNSYERDNPKPSTWRYRDYVIRAINDNKPYDQFIREQIAGDELVQAGAAGATPDVDAIIATGYYRLGIWDDEPTDREQARYDGLDDIVATTSQVFLGLSFDCARCHDHKIDPISQKDYYRLLGFFQNINHFRNGGPTDEVRLVTSEDGRQAIEPLPTERREADRPNRKPPAVVDTVLCVSESGPTAPDTFVLSRGNPHIRGEKVEPAFPEVLANSAAVIPTPSPDSKTCGRRLVLANWISSSENPLTARVMVNRLWQHHFGRGIVRSSSNFGIQGDGPTHPSLLDWLAAEFVTPSTFDTSIERTKAPTAWDLKRLHRLIVTSSAYRMSSRATEAGLAKDPRNDLFWKFDMRRLSAEEIRDSILAVSGTLSLKMFGPGVYTDIPAEVLAGQSRPGYGWGKSPPEEQARRSIYIHVKRSLLSPILESFDVAETDRTAPVRFVSTQPTQALSMLNGEFLNQQAERLAARLQHEVVDDRRKQVRLALYLTTCRVPSSMEIERGVKLMESLEHAEGVDPATALKYFCLTVLNLNEFLYLD